MASREINDKIIAFCIHKRFIKDIWRGERFVSSLPGNPDRIKEIFSRSTKFDYPVLEGISFWFHNYENDDQLEVLNKQLKHSGKKQISQEEIDIAITSIVGCSFQNDKEEPLHNENMRENIYEKIASSVTVETRLIGHFLLPFQDVHLCSNSTDQPPISEMLSRWTEITPKEELSWKRLKSILVFLGMKRLVNEINRDKLGIEEDIEEYEKTDDEEWNIKVTKDSPQVLTYTIDDNCYKNLPHFTLERPEFIELLTSGNTAPTKISFEHYVRRSKKFLSDFFMVEDDVLKENFRFPPEYMLENEIAKITSLFETDDSAIITHYDVIEHIKLFGIDTSEVCDYLNIDPESIGNPESRMLVCDLHERSIVNVRYTEATNENEALDDLKTGDRDLRLLLYMFGEQVLGTKCSILNVVAAPNIEEQCKNELILNREDLRPEVIRSKLRDLLKKVKMEELKEEEDRCKTAMTIFISLIFGFLAIRNITSTILFASPSEKLCSIWLTSEQVKAIFSENFWKVVIGGYGSGKSMIARYLLQHLAKYASMPTDIYYVLLDSHSLFTEDMYVFCRGVRDAIDHNVPVNIYYGNGEEVSRKLMPYLPDSKSFVCTLANILKALTIKYGMGKYQERRFHLIVDEVDGESLDKTQADSLREIFASYGAQLKQSHVMFLMRSMEKRRMYISGMKKTDYQSYHFYKQCGMKVLHLAKCMRNPQKVFDLIQSVVSMVEGCSNVIFQPETADQTLQEDDAVSILHHSLPDVRPQDDDKDDDEDDGNNDVDDVSVSQYYAAGLQDDADELAALLPTKENDLEDHLSEGTESGNVSISLMALPVLALDNMSDDDLPSEDYDIHHPNPNDIDAKAVVCNRRYNQSKHKIQTYFSYNQCNTVQHYIKGKPPKMIFLNSCEDEITMEAVRKLAIALDTLCFKDGDEKKTLIICHNTFELDLYANALDVLNVCYMVYYPELNIQRSFERSKIGELLLISDHNGSRGLEYEQVIVTLNPNDTFKWQYLVESMSRCTDQLILIVPYAYTERMVQSFQTEEEEQEKSSSCCWTFLKWITCNQDFDESLYWNEPFEEPPSFEDNTTHNIISKLKRTKPAQLCTFTVSMEMLPGERFLQTSEDENTTRLSVNLADNKIKKYTVEPAIQFRSWNSSQTTDSCIGRPRRVSGFICHYTSINGEKKMLLQWDKVDTPVVIRRQKAIDQPSRNSWEEIYRGVGTGFFVSDIDSDIERGYRYHFKINAISAVGSLESEDSLTVFPARSQYSRGERPKHIRSREDTIKINEHIRELNNTLQRVHVRGAKEISTGQQKVERNIAALQKCRTALLKFHGTEALIKSIDKSITNERMFLTSKLNTAAANQRLRLHRSRR